MLVCSYLPFGPLKLLKPTSISVDTIRSYDLLFSICVHDQKVTTHFFLSRMRVRSIFCKTIDCTRPYRIDATSIGGRSLRSYI